MLSRTIRLSIITLATGFAALASASIADAAAVHPNFGGSRTGPTQVTPKLPDVKAHQPVIHTNAKLMHCHPLRERNAMGIYVVHKYCN